MRNPDDLEYQPDSLLSPPSQGAIREFEDYINSITEANQITFGADYIRHIASFHGGIPNRRVFVTKGGHERLIERFLNFADRAKDPDLAQYHVGVVWSMVSDRTGENLIPFAVLFGGDLLCFDFRHTINPKIVVWLHEESKPGDDDSDFEPMPVTEDVADSFEALLSILSRPDRSDGTKS